MTPKQILILSALRRYFYMTAALIKMAASPKGDKDGSVTREQLRRLVAMGYIRRHEPRILEYGRTTAPPVFLLTIAGSCALAQHTGNLNHVLQVEPTFKDWISIHHYVSLAALHMRIDDAIAAQSYVTQHALYFEHEVICPDALEPSKRFRLNTLVAQNPNIFCCPDSAFEIEVRGQRRAVYVEREMGSDNPMRVVAKKHMGYSLLSKESFKKHFPLAVDMRVLAICPFPAWRDSLRAAFKESRGGLKAGAHLWQFVAAEDLTTEKFLHEPIVYKIEQKEGKVVERGPVPFTPRPPGQALSSGGDAGGSDGGTL